MSYFFELTNWYVDSTRDTPGAGTFFLFLLLLVMFIGTRRWGGKLSRAMIWPAILLNVAGASFLTFETLTSFFRTFLDVTLGVLGNICMWGLLFHVVAHEFGPWFTKKFGPSWVKAIDYLYLLGSSLGLLRIAVSPFSTPTEMTEPNALGVVLLGTALALRVTKTSIEIFGWDKVTRNTPVSA